MADPRERGLKTGAGELLEERSVGHSPHQKPWVRAAFQPPASSSDVLLRVNRRQAIDLAIPLARFEEDMGDALRQAASDAYTETLRENPDELRLRSANRPEPEPTRRARVRFIQKRLKLTDSKLAEFLGITANQVRRLDLRTRRKKQMGTLDQRLNGLTTIAHRLGQGISGYPGEIIDRRVSIASPNGTLNISVGDAIAAGYPHLGVAAAMESKRELWKK